MSVLSERDRAEAGVVTAHQAGHDFELQLGHLCNNRCVFCSSGQLTELGIARHIPLEPILGALEAARAAGARKVTFLGGEPTLHKGLPRALARSVELGFEQVVIFTNGVLFPKPGFLEELCGLGRFEWRVSIQGGDEATHVAVTGRADSFRRIVIGLARLRALGQRVTVNVCANELSHASLPGYASLIREHGISQLHVDVVRPASTGERSADHLRAILPRYVAMAPNVAALLASIDRDDPAFDVNVGNLPFCVLPEWGHRIHHGGDETITQPCDATDLTASVDKYAWHGSLRRHLPACDGCVFLPDCAGVFSEYLEIHGGAEFAAVSRERLLALDPERRQLVRLVEPWLGELVAAIGAGALGPGWRVDGVARDTRAASVELRLGWAGRGATLRVVPPGRAGPETLVVTSLAAIGLGGAATAPPADLAALCEALVGWCVSAEGGDVVEQRAVAPVVARAVASAGRADPAIGLWRLAARLQARRQLGEFAWAGARAREGRVVVTFREASRAEFDIELRWVRRGARARPWADFRIRAPGREAAAEAAVLEAIGALREGGAGRAAAGRLLG
ncbi:MAG: radical SAM protein [Polyangiaceae bacterium]|nr:radical SAM protein [Polyangiaceae bacterium]